MPENPLSQMGLATPYLLTATNPAAGACHEANPNQTAFVQSAIINTKTGQISIYDPLVIDMGTHAGRGSRCSQDPDELGGGDLVRLQRQ